MSMIEECLFYLTDIINKRHITFSLLYTKKKYNYISKRRFFNHFVFGLLSWSRSYLYQNYVLSYCIAEIFLKLTVDGIPDDQTIEIIELRALNGTTVDSVEIVDAAIGSLVIWTRMSTTVLQTKDKFLTTIEKVMKELFNKSPVDINQTVDVTIGITIADEFQDGKSSSHILNSL